MKISYTHQHADFSASRLSEYELHLMVSGKSFIYLMCLPEGKVHAIREIRFTENPDLKGIQQVFQQESILQEKFSKVIWICDSTRFLLCPEEYLRYEEAENLYSETRDAWQVPGAIVLNSLGEALRCTLIHEPEADLRRLLEQNFPGIEFRHVITRTLYQANRIHQTHQPIVTVLITAFDGYFTLNILNRTGPVLSQIFQAETADDYLYYLLWSCQQLNISIDHVTLWVSGNFHTPTPVIDLLSSYFSGVKYLPGLTGSSWFSADSRVPVLHYIGLLPELP
jgi:hypothetical protein